MSVPRNRRSNSLFQSALKAARATVRQGGGKRNIIIPLMLPLPTEIGGFLPATLVPVFAGLSAIGSLADGTASIVNAINKAGQEK